MVKWVLGAIGISLGITTASYFGFRPKADRVMDYAKVEDAVTSVKDTVTGYTSKLFHTEKVNIS